MPPFAITAVMGLSEEKMMVMPIIERLSAKMECRICHLDLHFLNIMIPENGLDYRIIDWMNARLAPPVFDYARTYVIFEEFSVKTLNVIANFLFTSFRLKKVRNENNSCKFTK